MLWSLIHIGWLAQFLLQFGLCDGALQGLLAIVVVERHPHLPGIDLRLFWRWHGSTQLDIEISLVLLHATGLKADVHLFIARWMTCRARLFLQVSAGMLQARLDTGGMSHVCFIHKSGETLP